MNQAICKQLELDLGKIFFMFICLENKLSLSLYFFSSIIKRTKLIHNNVFMNKHVNIRAQFNSI